MVVVPPNEAGLQQIDQLLDEEEFRYQSIRLPDGRRTSGSDRSATLDLILPADLRGKSLLDLGCRYGFFSFEAAKRGASRVLGIDFDDDALAKAHKINAVSRAGVEFKKFDISKDEIGEQFDFVLCLNVLHHLQDPLGVLAKLVKLTRERLVLEVAGLRGRDTKKLFQLRDPASWTLYPIPLLQPLLDRLPIVVLGAENRAFEANFFFSRTAIQRLLLNQNNVFWKVEIFASPFKGRFICIAQKLRIGELLIVAGPPTSGKSHFIRRLTAGECPQLEPLGVQTGAPWIASAPHHIHELPTPHVPRLAYHYDFLRAYLRGPFNIHRDRATDVFGLADAVKSVTLISNPDELARRWREREIDPKTFMGLQWGGKRSKKMLKALGDPEKLIPLYDRWMDFIRKTRGEHFLLDTRSSPHRLHSIAEWPAIRTSLSDVSR
jgi:SAM-dependent methyltransferase